ncbi:hypothetical protein BO94DRAFT_531874 [Aspergillus sclerotioniger CBS 115572]|uniref:PBP domain-containing protein n=1 Tax=Aspergillus sclerotioniger CBS 115572 TaxID=1450535 RepID=A0A317X6T7_9EURO|nr:hypothetical protein BO94DRAFT_531874 [Aspergillus sclerotioniger CBS 115572]PWY93881.1 hypothetical protein BO94DRAFT_531874 [Aspergillus sclerotioniger CBS 115572]
MTYDQIAVGGGSCYLLRTNGTVKMYSAYSINWVTLGQDESNRQIVGNGPFIRRANGEVYEYKEHKWKRLDTLTKMWVWGDITWRWQEQEHLLSCHDFGAPDEWRVRGGDTQTKDLVMVQNSIYQLAEDGTISYLKKGKWKILDDKNATAIATDDNSLFKLDKQGFVSQLYGQQQWQLVGVFPIVQIAAGRAGLFARHENGSIYEHCGGMIWNQRDMNTDNVHLAVGDDAYRVNSKGELYRFDRGERNWELLHSNLTISQTKEQIANHIPSNPILSIGIAETPWCGVLRSLALGFIDFHASISPDPFNVAWNLNTSAKLIESLQNGKVDIVIASHVLPTRPEAETAAGSTDTVLYPMHYLFNDHVLLVGPPSNPAGLDPESHITTMLADLVTAGERNPTCEMMFLGRSGDSAIKAIESDLWNQVRPWMIHSPNWYQETVMTDQEMDLATAGNLNMYTLTERSFFQFMGQTALGSRFIIYKSSEDAPDEIPPIPAHLVISAQAQASNLAKDFAAWVTGPEGRAVVKNFNIGTVWGFSAPTN